MLKCLYTVSPWFSFFSTSRCLNEVFVIKSMTHVHDSVISISNRLISSWPSSFISSSGLSLLSSVWSSRRFSWWRSLRCWLCPSLWSWLFYSWIVEKFDASIFYQDFSFHIWLRKKLITSFDSFVMILFPLFFICYY